MWNFTPLKFQCFSRIACIFVVFFLSGLPGSVADTVRIPNYSDPRERIPVPSLAGYGRIRFITTLDFPPLNFLDQSGRLAGFHVDLARAICAELKISARCQIQALPWNELEGALSKGQAEAMIAGLSITAKTRKTYRFTRPYLQLPARFIVRKDKGPEKPDLEKSDLEKPDLEKTATAALAGQKIGVLEKTAHEAMLRDWFPGLTPVTFSKPELLFDALKAGDIDAVFGDGLQLSFWLSSQMAQSCCQFFDGPYFSQAYLGEGLAIAVSPKNAQLTSAFNHAIAAMDKDGRFEELYLRWFPNGFY